MDAIWDFIDCDEDNAEDIDVDFTPMTRTKDPLCEADPVDGDSDGNDADLYDDEEAMFANKKKTYQDDPEMLVGFPEDKQEYDAVPCLADVLEEYESHTKGRALKPIKKGMGLMLHGDPNFFDDTEVEE